MNFKGNVKQLRFCCQDCQTLKEGLFQLKQPKIAQSLTQTEHNWVHTGLAGTEVIKGPLRNYSEAKEPFLFSNESF